MKQFLLLLVALPQFCYSQTVTITHTYYTTTFDTTKRIPTVVKWRLTKEMVSCSKHIKRTNKFTADPQLPKYTNLNKDYAGSGYDRGHNMPAEGNACTMTGMDQCFYYSNMCPHVEGHFIPHGRAKLIPHPIVNGNKFTSPAS